MAAEAGVGGNVKSGANVIADVDTWSLTIKSDVGETTSFGATGSWRTRIPTIKDWSAKFAGRLNPVDTLGQVILINGIGTQIALVFSVDATHQWAGNGIITQIDPKSDAKGLNTLDIAVDGNGPILFT